MNKNKETYFKPVQPTQISESVINESIGDFSLQDDVTVIEVDSQRTKRGPVTYR